MRIVTSLCLGIAAFGLHAVAAWGQSPSVGDGSHIIRFSDALAAKGIPITPTGLAVALHNGDPSTRASAAAVLAEIHAPDAVSLIESAMASETEPATEIQLASILISLGDTAGTIRLKTLCESPSKSAETISYAAAQLVLRGDGSECVDEPLRRLRSRESSTSEKAELLTSVGSLFQLASSKQQDEIMFFLKQHIGDQEQTTRLVASRSLALTGSPASRTILESALKKENDPIVRASIQSDLSLFPAGGKN